MNKEDFKTLAIDVDQTVVDMREEWITWCKDKLQINLDLSEEISDPEILEFWSQEDIYCNKKPLKDATKYVNKLYNKYYIIFVSACHPNHLNSKINFLLKYFKFDGFINTSEKNIVNFDYIIDDREIFFKNIDSSKCIKFTNNWEEIYNYLEQL